MKSYQEILKHIQYLISLKALDYSRKEITDRIVAWQKGSSNEEVLPRGIYCSNPVDDIVTGGLYRGLLRKTSRCLKSGAFRFGFDKEDELVFCQRYWSEKPPSLAEEEYIFEHEGARIGISLCAETAEVIRITRCTYQEKRIKNDQTVHEVTPKS